MKVEFKQYKELVKKIPIGKQLPDAVYLHESALDILPKKLGRFFVKVLMQLDLDKEDWNIIKFYKRDFKVTLLNYPYFIDAPYPLLHASFTINLDKITFRKADYSKSGNPPILHRKETFVKSDHPEFNKLKDITNEGEEIGLYENTKTIGYKKNWERLIKSKGYYISERWSLIPLCDAPIKETPGIHDGIFIDRYKTAIDRNKLSQPMQALARHSYLNG